MSGASALAAAKRRRAVPAAESGRPISSSSNLTQNQSQIPKQVQPTVPSNVQTPGQNPLLLLLQHEQRLIDIEKGVSELNVNSKKPESLNNDTLQYFKTQQDLLSQEIQDLKKIIIKVQTFSMETNLDLIKIKKTLKMIDSNESS
jgi:hypothetical protein